MLKCSLKTNSVPMLDKTHLKVNADMQQNIVT